MRWAVAGGWEKKGMAKKCVQTFFPPQGRAVLTSFLPLRAHTYWFFYFTLHTLDPFINPLFSS